MSRHMIHGPPFPDQYLAFLGLRRRVRQDERGESQTETE